MSKFLREEDISAGFRAPLYSVPVCIPQCNVCAYWDGPENVRNMVRHLMNFVGESVMIAQTQF